MQGGIWPLGTWSQDQILSEPSFPCLSLLLSECSCFPTAEQMSCFHTGEVSRPRHQSLPSLPSTQKGQDLYSWMRLVVMASTGPAWGGGGVILSQSRVCKSMAFLRGFWKCFWEVLSWFTRRPHLAFKPLAQDTSYLELRSHSALNKYVDCV